VLVLQGQRVGKGGEVMAFLWYLAAPLRPMGAETYVGNIREARRVARCLVRSGHCITAPWLWSATERDDLDDGRRAAGISCNLEALERCDGLVCVGRRISPGMREEERHAKRHKLRVVHALSMPWRGVARFMRLIEGV